MLITSSKDIIDEYSNDISFLEKAALSAYYILRTTSIAILINILLYKQFPIP